MHLPIHTSDAFDFGKGAAPAKMSSPSKRGGKGGRGGRASPYHRPFKQSTRAQVPSSPESKPSITSVDEVGFAIIGDLINAKNALTALTSLEGGVLQLVSMPLPSPTEQSLSIRWSKIRPAPYFESVRIRLIVGNQTVTEETLTWQRFPSSSAGTLSLGPVSLCKSRIVVEFQLLPTGTPKATTRLLAEKSLGKPISLPIATRCRQIPPLTLQTGSGYHEADETRCLLRVQLETATLGHQGHLVRG